VEYIFDPSSPEFHRDPYTVYRYLRDHQPLYRDTKYGFWALSRFDDVFAAARDPRTFSSVNEMVTVLYPMLNFLDAPLHQQLRGLVSRAFTPRRVAEMEATIREFANDLIDGFIENDHCDLIRDFAGPLASQTVGQLIGIPRDEQGEFRHWTDKLVTLHEIGSSNTLEEIATNIYRLFRDLLERRRSDPADDLMTALLDAKVEGRALTEEELLGFCFLLVSGGNDTTTHLIGHGVVLLAQHPEQRQLLLDDRSLLPNAIEETLRFEPPAQHHVRTTTRDVTLHGEMMPSGSHVLLLWGAANRDDREFEDPDRFEVSRQTERHLAFGLGPHYCLGASLARLEARVAFEEILDRLPQFQLEAEPEHAVCWVLRAYEELAISF
jgi:cytochrome P450